MLKETSSLTKTLGNIPVLKIRDITMNSPLVLAPMAGVSNHAFRVLCKRLGGCGLVCSEMFSSYAIKFRDPKTKNMLDWTKEERPISVQVFGGDPEACSIGARFLEENGANIIDINFGCPVPKVAKSGSGASILKDLSKAESIIKTVRKVVNVPLTVKTRLGWFMDMPTVFEFVKIAEACGVDAISIHGRYAQQKYTGIADWETIAQVREIIPNMPLIANGDINSPKACKEIFKKTGCNGAMIARAAHGKPWIFKHMYHYLETGEFLPEPDFKEVIEIAKKHNQILCDIHGDKRASKEMRGYLVHYIRGFDNSAKIRDEIMHTKSSKEIEGILDEASNIC